MRVQIHEVPGSILVGAAHRLVAESLADALADGSLADAAHVGLEPQAVSAMLDAERPAVLVVVVDRPGLACADAAVAAAGEPSRRCRTVAVVASGATSAADVVVPDDIGLADLRAIVHGDAPAARHPSEAGGETATPADAHLLDRLTARELEVLAALVGGWRGEVIARELGISPATVRTHIQNVFRKLGVDSRHRAAVIARRAGLAPASPRTGPRAATA